MDRLRELVRLHRLGSGSREVARLLELSPKTELKYRRAIEEAGLLDGPADDLPELEALKEAVLTAHPPAKRAPTQSSVQAWMPRIEAALAAGVPAKALWDQLRRQEEGFTASYAAVRRAYVRLKKARGVRPEDVAIPVDTAPGELAQVDFGYVGKLFDARTGKARKAWVFVMTLGHSRHMFAHVVFDQKAETWQELHVAAFAHFGGVPRVIVPDNLKSAVVRGSFNAGDRHHLELNRGYRELARHYGFKIDPAPVYSPEKKGKVEAAVKYVKGNYFAAKAPSLVGLEEVNSDLHDWVMHTAGTRIHGSTGERPLDAFEERERAALLPLPSQRYERWTWRQVTVHPDSHVQVDGKLYSVPWRHVGRQLWARAGRHSVELYWKDTRVATHERPKHGRRVTDPTHLPAERQELANRSEDYWRRRAYALDPAVGAYVDEVFASDPVLSKLRDVQAIVTELRKYPLHRAVSAVARASYYGNFTFVGVREILRKALDLEELPAALVPSPDHPGEMRFARSADELLANHQEDSHEPH